MVGVENGSHFTSELRCTVKQEQQQNCGYCTEREPLQVHHIIPKSLGGTHTRDNAVALCEPCHQVFNTLIFDHNITYLQIMLQGDLIEEESRQLPKVTEQVQEDPEPIIIFSR